MANKIVVWKKKWQKMKDRLERLIFEMSDCIEKMDIWKVRLQREDGY